MPIPVEQIMERQYGIEIEWHELDEPPGTSILGAIDPHAMVVVLNSRHERLFSEVLGPYEFTLAHELGHLLFDADDPNQLNLLQEAGQRFCHSRKSTGMSRTQQEREWNANRFAAELLMPADLVRQVDEEDLVAHVGEYAQRWGVSHTALSIRLKTLGIVADGPPEAGLW